MARLAARSTAADDTAAWHIATLRARVKVGMVLRQALVQLGIDPATLAMLQIDAESAQELAVTADSAEGLEPGRAGACGPRPVRQRFCCHVRGTY
jgi:hypothetical protein